MLPLAGGAFDVPTLVLFRTGISLVYICLISGKFLSLFYTKHLGQHLFRGILGTSSVFAIYYAMNLVTLTNALTLYLTAPLFLPFIAFLWKGIKIEHALWPGIIVAFIGVLIVIHPDQGIFEWGSDLALYAGVVMAMMLLYVRYMHETEKSETILFYFFLLSFAISLIVWLVVSRAIPQTGHGWFYLIFSAFFGALYQHMLTLSAKRAPVRMTSPILYCSLIFSLPFDYFVFHRVPSGLEWLGIGCIVMGLIVLTLMFPRTPTGLEKNR
jgi:drug/metabolite transporter (DMT)-like permease